MNYLSLKDVIIGIVNCEPEHSLISPLFESLSRIERPMSKHLVQPRNEIICQKECNWFRVHDKINSTCQSSRFIYLNPFTVRTKNVCNVFLMCLILFIPRRFPSLFLCDRICNGLKDKVSGDGKAKKTVEMCCIFPSSQMDGATNRNLYVFVAFDQIQQRHLVVNIAKDTLQIFEKYWSVKDQLLSIKD